MDILINDYINGEHSLCRDEIQFSVYLFQLLSGCRRAKINSENYINKNYEVLQAYYRPAFLRDYFNCADNKALFNQKLLMFADRKLRALYAGDEAAGVMLKEVDPDRISGEEIYDLDMVLPDDQTKFDMGKHINGWTGEQRRYRNPLARWMMNTCADIAVLLKRRGIKRTELRMQFVDCHYLSGVDTYPALVGRTDSEGKIKNCKKLTCTKQQIEQYVLEFLCDTPSEEYADVLGVKWFGPAKESDITSEYTAVAIDTGFVSIANFASNKNEHLYEEADRPISVKKLQEYNRAYFSEERKIKEPKVIFGGALDIQF